MLKTYFKFISILLVSLVLLSLLHPFEVSANDDNSSYHSAPEKIVYESLNFNNREIDLLDNWKFHYGDVSGAAEMSYSDSDWRNVSIPHDYSLELDYDLENGEAESGYKLGGIGWYRKTLNIPMEQKGKRFVVYFDGVYNNAEIYVNGNLLGVHPYGYTPFAFDLTPYIQYGATNLLAVKVNHKFPSSRWYSGSGIYRPVKLIVTNDVYVDLWGVKITNSDFDPNNLGNITTNINTVVVNSSNKLKNVEVKQSLLNKDNETVVTSTKNVEVAANSSSSVSIDMNVGSPNLWSLDNPYLYKMKTELLVDGKIVDTSFNDYGFRKIEFDRVNGFSLNGKLMKLQGVSMHHDQGALGSRAFEDAIERQVDILKDMGVNAIRVTHNPASSVLVDVANRKGMLLIDEFFDTWFRPKNDNRFDNSENFSNPIGASNKIIGKTSESMPWWEFDVSATVKSSINAPSIIAWSLGNELQEGLSNYNDPKKTYENMGKTMSDFVYSHDSSRLVTFGDNKIKAKWKNVEEIADNIAKSSPNGKGLIGFNYADGDEFDNRFKNKDNWILYASETSSAVNSRGFYKRVYDNGRTSDQNLTSYDNSKVGWGHMSAQSWYMIIQRDYMAGEFIWTGFDYLGEPTHWNGVGKGAQAGNKSPKSSYFGIVDLAGLPKDRYYFYRSQWNKKDTTLHMLPVWKEDAIVVNDGKVKVDVYTNARTVKLLFQEQNSNEWSEIASKTFSLKTSRKNPSSESDGSYTYQLYEGEGKSNNQYENLYFSFLVPYKNGTLKAIAYDENNNEIKNTVGRNQITTYGAAYKLELASNKEVLTADGNSLAYLTVTVKDKNGNVVEDANVPVTVDVVGSGAVFEAQDNGRQNDLTPYSQKTRNTFNGKSVVIVKSTKKVGDVSVKVSSPNLKSDTVKLISKANVNQSGDINYYEMVKNYYLSTGSKFNPLTDLVVYKSDNSKDTDTIEWKDVNSVDVNNPGVYIIKGISSKYKIEVSAQVNVISQIAAILNYSTAVPVGTNKVNLPTTRPAVLQNGDLVKEEFPVKWDLDNSNLNLNKVGFYTVNGYATVLNKQYPVVARIRVGDKTKISTGNVAGGAKLSQNITITSDRLGAINDGVIGTTTGSAGNENIWTNYNHSLQGEGNNNAEIILNYATNTIADKLVVYWYQDSWAAKIPEKVELYHKQDEDSWTKIENVKVEVGETKTAGGSVTKYTYSFDRAEFLNFKLDIEGKQGKTGKRDGNGKDVYYCVGIGELELYGSTDEMILNSNILPVGATLNGKNLFSDDLDSTKSVSESAAALWFGDNAENVALTKLPVYDNKQIFYVESENNQTRKKIVVLLNQPDQPLKANDASRDIDPHSMSYNVVNFAQGNETDLAFDNRLDTIWHNDWTKPPLSDDQRYIEMVLNEPTRIEALRYHKRISGGDNGTVKKYSIQVVREGETNFEEVASGSWDVSANEWQQATFNPVVVTKVRLYGVETVGDGGRTNHFMSAAEIRVRKTHDNAVDLNSLGDELTIKIDGLEPKVIDETVGRVKLNQNQSAAMPSVSIMHNNQYLLPDVDYVIDYQNCYMPGIASIKIVGLGRYKGEILKKYEIYIDKDPFIVNSDVVENKKANAFAFVKNDNSDATNLYSGYILEIKKIKFNHSLDTQLATKVNADENLTYQIKLLNSEKQSVQPLNNTLLKIHLPLESKFKENAVNKKLIVLHYHGNGNDTKVESINYDWDANSEMLVISLDKLSEIAIFNPVLKEPVDSGNNDNKPKPGDGNDNKPKPGDGNDNKPKPGDGNDNKPRPGDGNDNKPKPGDGNDNKPKPGYINDDVKLDNNNSTQKNYILPNTGDTLSIVSISGGIMILMGYVILIFKREN